MIHLKGEPGEGDSVLLEVESLGALPRLVRPYLSINPQVVRYWGRQREGAWFQVPESTLKGQALPSGEANDWGDFSFFLKWEHINTIVRLVDQPASVDGNEPVGFKPKAKASEAQSESV